MSEHVHRSPAQPAVVLGLTFLALGLTFGLPYMLVPQLKVSAMSNYLSPETANVYACVAWAGWAHFLYAFRGQGNALLKLKKELGHGRMWTYIAAVAVTIAILIALRWLSGPAIFGAIVWVYFIDHFLKAELAFEGRSPANASMIVRWLSSYQPLLTFGWLSIVLLNAGGITNYPWLMWLTSLLLAIVVLVFGGWRQLTSGESRNPLLSLFFVGESLVWGAFSHDGGPMFMTGVYIFHVAAGSYFHYFGSYFVARARTTVRDVLLAPAAILFVNLGVIGLGYLSARVPALDWLTPILGIQWFTLWVAVHLVSSDLFPAIKSWRKAPTAA